MSDGILDDSLRVAGYEAYCCAWRLVQAMGQRDLSGFETVLVNNMLFRCEDKPDWLSITGVNCVGGICGVFEEVFGS